MKLERNAKKPPPGSLRSPVEDELWYRGQLRHLLKKDGQRRVYDFTTSWKKDHPILLGPLVFNCHRAFGKSYMLLVFCIERCLQKPNQEVKFGAPTLKQCEEIVRPIIRQVLSSAPESLRPTTRGNRFIFQNPRWNDPDAYSTLTLVGCKEDAESQRGLRSDVVVLDECRNIPRFEYVTNDIFLYHFATRKDPLLILSSTPPASPDHPWARIYLADAKRDDRYICVPTTENEDFTADDEQMLRVACRDENSWRREALCELIADTTRLIIPEFQGRQGEIVVESYKRPDNFFPIVSIDFGFMDFTAALFGYVDYHENILVIEDEVVTNYETTGEIARRVLQKESFLWPNTKYPIRRFGDNAAQQLADLRRDYGVHISAADKYDKESACRKLGDVFLEKRIRIFSRCKNLITQLNCGLRDEKGNFERGETVGHCDAIDALIYMNRMVNWRANPHPEAVRDMSTHWYADQKRAEISASNSLITRNPVFVMKQRLGV